MTKWAHCPAKHSHSKRSTGTRRSETEGLAKTPRIQKRLNLKLSLFLARKVFQSSQSESHHTSILIIWCWLLAGSLAFRWLTMTVSSTVKPSSASALRSVPWPLRHRRQRPLRLLRRLVWHNPNWR